MTESEKKVYACVQRLCDGFATSVWRYYSKSKLTGEMSEEEFTKHLDALCDQGLLEKHESSQGKFTIANYILAGESHGGFTLTMGNEEQAKEAIKIVRKHLRLVDEWRKNVKRKGNVIFIDTNTYLPLHRNEVDYFCEEIAKTHPDFSFEITALQVFSNSKPKNRAYYEAKGTFVDGKYELCTHFTFPDVNEYGKNAGRVTGTSIRTNKIVGDKMFFSTQETLE